jgi:hypothetical protein
MPPPGMLPPRKRGGRTVGVRDQGPGDTGGTDGPAWKSGRKAGTQVQHVESGKIDSDDIGRGKQITYARGGHVAGVSVPVKPAKPFYGHGKGHARGGNVTKGTSVSIAPVERGANNVSKPVKPASAEDYTSRAALPAKPISGIDHAGSRSGIGRLKKSRMGHAGMAP